MRQVIPRGAAATRRRPRKPALAHALAACAALVLAVPAVAAPAVEQPAPSAPPPAPPADDPAARAQAIYAEGQVLFDLADYEGALARWTEAYMLLPRPRQRLKMMFTLAETHMRAYETTRDPSHLRRARLLFAQFLDSVQRLDEGRETLSKDFIRASTRVEEIDANLAARERAAVEERELLKLIARGTLRVEPSPGVKTMRAAGVTLVTAGGVALALMVTGLVLGARASDEVGLASLPEDERALLLRRGQRFDRLAIAGGVLAGATLAAGVPLLVVARRRGAREREQALLRLHPVLAPTSFGLVWEGRF